MFSTGGKWLHSSAGLTLDAGGGCTEVHMGGKVGSSGKNGQKADSVFSLPKVPLASGDDTAPR